ncbi:MAG: ATP-binding protein [Robiginitomaculum sp.]|nr:ATP-binding protein [Robiginitomaculum sp.]
MAIKNFYADTSPNKVFVIDTFTRDASVEECIFDLIDNSIDAARNKLDNDGKLALDDDGLVDDYSGIEIIVSIDQNKVSVSDNCSGMSPKDIEDGILRFGRPSNAKYSIGLYGIGLNRAIYKLGEKTKLSSETIKNRSIVDINMRTYRDDNDEWLIPAQASTLTGITGSTIEISEPNNEIEHILGDPFFISNLIKESSVRYSSFIQKGLYLRIDNARVNAKLVETRVDGPLKPLTKNYTASNGVRVRIRAGQHDLHRFTIEPDFDKEQNKSIIDDFGWSIICNDRVVIHSNKEQKTGWEAIWHSEFNGFVGTVEFIAEDGRKLPWTTAKSDLNISNTAYQEALLDMRRFTREWRTFGNKVKKMRLAKDVLVAPPPKKPREKPTPTKIKKPIIKPKPKPVNKPKTYRTVLPSDVDEKHCQDKLLSLVHEGKGHDLYDSHYTSLALIRMLFETSCVCFFIRHKLYQKMIDECIKVDEKNKGITLTAKKKKDYVPDLAKMLLYLIDNYDDWKLDKGKMLKRSVENFKKHKGTVNDSIHHPLSQITQSTAIQIRDEVMPVLRHFIED